MKAYDMVDALEDDKFPVPDQAKIRVLTPDAQVFDIVTVEYEPETNTVWLKVEEEE